jgi:hypothetical protein
MMDLLTVVHSVLNSPAVFEVIIWKYYISKNRISEQWLKPVVLASQPSLYNLNTIRDPSLAFVVANTW